VLQGLDCERDLEKVQTGFHDALLAVAGGYTSTTGRPGEM